MKWYNRLGTKLIGSVFIIILLCMVMLQINNFRTSFILIRNTAIHKAESTKLYMLQTINVPTLLQLSTQADIQKKDYVETKQFIENLQKSSGAKFLYISKKESSGEWSYFADGYPSGDPLYTDFGTPIEADYQSIYSQIEKDGQDVTGTFEDASFGKMMSSYFPVKDASGKVYGVIGMDFDVSYEYSLFMKSVLQSSFITLVAIFLSILVFFSISLQITNPIKKMVKMSERIAEFNLSGNFEMKEDKTELGILEKALKQMVMNNRSMIGQITSAAKEVSNSHSDILLSEKHLSESMHDISTSINSLSSGIVHQADDTTKAKVLGIELDRQIFGSSLYRVGKYTL